MLDTIAATCRALASDGSLLLLRHLAGQKELLSSELARRTRLPQSQTSTHLARLALVGGVHRRRSGGRVYYAFSSPSRATLSFEPWGLVERAFLNASAACRGWQEDRIVHLARRTVQAVEPTMATVMDVIFDACTAFTNVRRLRLLELLKRNGPCTRGSIVAELKMSDVACGRHLHKLARRGYVRIVNPGAWGFAREPRTRLHARLLELVLPWLDA
ncbi:MAG: winged helix-turn-helix transcriptional regulator [Planctomycetes bacterium]|nr:winged helix-turn-helix transcriptional regulator [Planctomycetota bacterium]